MKNIIMKILILLLSKKNRIKLFYRIRMKRKLNLNNPKALSEKIQLRKFKSEAIYSELSDKVSVKSYVEGLNIKNLKIIPNIYTGYSLTESILNSFPKEFVVKSNYGSHDVSIIKDKSSQDLSKLAKKYNSLLKAPNPYFEFSGEDYYLNIPKMILVEELLPDVKTDNPIDYKFHCFNSNGEFDFILQYIERSKSGELTMCYFDSKLSLKKYAVSNEKYKTYSDKSSCNIPDNIEEMIEVAKQLSKDFDYVRVDLYSISNKIYFGELTFTPASGFLNYITTDADLELGEMWVTER